MAKNVATKWTKRGNEWRRGPLRVCRAPWNSPVGGNGVDWQARFVVSEGSLALPGPRRTVTRDTRISWHRTPEAAMRAADKWAAKMLKALKKVEGAK